ncbi:MAG TPA: ubiquinol-cytochrome c reductase iron-sulfur subunit [Polyangia bacterium]|jgi:menaquinol-cytochrome c reductase iron-sulfur subunit|nr:ubiquinol-cytochrome c reductase iron-sulfur subunit [Polyangia bacterium]
MNKNDDPKDDEKGAEKGGDKGPPLADPQRRRFLSKVSITLGVVGGAALSVPGVVFVVAPIFRDPPSEWRSLGKVASFEVGATVNVVFVDASPLPWAGVSAKSAAWLRRTGEQEFMAFSVNCAHLGCPVRWVEKARLFMCPCHGGVYYEDGRVAAGPPPHGLAQYPVRIREGEVEISTQPIPIG